MNLSLATICNYLGDVRLFVAWCEQRRRQNTEAEKRFSPKRVSMPLITAYRDHLNDGQQRKPINISNVLFLPVSCI